MDDKELVVRQIASRIKAARLSSNLGVEEAAAAWGVSKASQYNYESGARVPDALYLLEMWKGGIDLQHIVTGHQPLLREHLAAGEVQLLKAWENLEADDKRTVTLVIEMALRGKSTR